MLLFSVLIAMFPKKLPTSKSKVDVEVNSNNKQDVIVGEKENNYSVTKQPESENNMHRNAKSLEKFQLVEEDEVVPSIKGKSTLLSNTVLVFDF